MKRQRRGEVGGGSRAPPETGETPETPVGLTCAPADITDAATYCDQIDEGHGVVVDAPQGHDANGVHGDHDDGQQVEETRAQVQAQQQAAHHERGQQAEGDDGEALRHDGQVLLVEDVRDPGRAARGTPLTREQKPPGELRDRTYVYGNTSNAGSVPWICRMPRVMLWASSRAFSSAWVNSCELVRGVWYAMNREAGEDKHAARARHNTSPPRPISQELCLETPRRPSRRIGWPAWLCPTHR